MSEFKAKLAFCRVSPQKTRIVANSIRGKNVNEAIAALTFVNKKPAIILSKLLNSAIANAVDIEEKINVDELYLKEIQVNEGKPWKRGLRRARGRMSPIRKRTSHIHIVLSNNKPEV